MKSFEQFISENFALKRPHNKIFDPNYEFYPTHKCTKNLPGSTGCVGLLAEIYEMNVNQMQILLDTDEGILTFGLFKSEVDTYFRELTHVEKSSMKYGI